MAVDGIMLNSLVEELKPIFPAKLNKIQQLSKDELLLTVHHKRKYKLFISCHSKYNRFNLTEINYKAIDFPSNFLMVLRKYIDGAIINNVSQIGLDRIVRFEITTSDDLKDKHNMFVYLELMGKYANLVLVDEDNKIVDCLKRIPPYENTSRTLFPGAVYKLPKAHIKNNPFDYPQIDLNRSLVEQLHGFSPLLSNEVLYRINELDENFNDIIDEIKNSQTIYAYQKDFHVIELKHLKDNYKKLPLSTGLDTIYNELEEQVRIKQQSGDVRKFVKNEIKKHKNKLKKLEATLDEAYNSEENAKYGELLYAYEYQLKDHIKQAEVVDFETNETIAIPLDSKLTIKQNAKKYFQKYNKSKTAKIEVQNQIDICINRINYFERLDSQLEIANVEDAIEIREELINNGYLRNKKIPKRLNKKKVRPNFTHLKIDNYDIYIGKNNVQNDYITWKLAKKNDLWFHTKDIHGSHILIKKDNEIDDFDDNIIRIGAILASYFSKARYSSSVPVNYCYASQLKKVKNSALGFVQLGNYNTIYIDPDEEYVNNLINEFKIK